MSWIKIALALLSLARFAVDQFKRSSAIAEGERRAIAAAMNEVAEAAGIARQIEAETEGMTAEEIMRDLDQHGELRP